MNDHSLFVARDAADKWFAGCRTCHWTGPPRDREGLAHGDEIGHVVDEAIESFAKALISGPGGPS